MAKIIYIHKSVTRKILNKTGGGSFINQFERYYCLNFGSHWQFLQRMTETELFFISCVVEFAAKLQIFCTTLTSWGF